MSAPLTANSLYRFFHAGDEETLALRGVSLALQPGELVAVSGPSGSGKSTLLSCLAGLDEPDGGTVHVDGKRLTRQDERTRARIRARRIGVLYQSWNLLEHLDIESNVALAQRLSGVSGDFEDPQGLLDRLGIRHRREALPSQLSGGELARAGLAVALANSPSILLCDEPTGELDRETALGVLRLLNQTAAEGASILIVTHSDEIVASADREIRLRDGRVVS